MDGYLHLSKSLTIGCQFKQSNLIQFVVTVVKISAEIRKILHIFARQQVTPVGLNMNNLTVGMK